MATTYSSPGVYIEEVPAGPKPIAGVPTGVLAIVGKTERGPLLTPKRITGFGEFEAVYGGVVSGSYTLASVWGYFENGGGACYVVRCDPSSAASWSVTDGRNPAVEVMEIQATSPGAWANDLVVTVARQTGGGALRAFARLTGAGDAQLPANSTQANLDVDRTSGFQVGDTAVLVDPVANVTRDVTVNAVVSATEIRVDYAAQNAAAAFAKGASALVSTVAANQTTVVLPVAAGFKAGDVVMTVVPGGNVREAHLQDAAVANQGMSLRLDAGFGAAVPAAGFAARRLRFPVRFRVKAADNSKVGRTDVVPGDPLAPTAFVNADRLYAYGMEATYAAANNEFTFPAAVRDGNGEVETDHDVRSFSQPVSIPGGNTADIAAALTERFAFLKPGTAVRLTTNQSPAVNHEVSRTAGGFNAANATAAAGVTYVQATVLVPVGVDTGVVLQSARAPEVGDFVRFTANAVRRANAVEELAPTVYQVKFDGGVLANAPGTGSWPVLTWLPTSFSALRFGITVRRTDWTELERFDGLSTDPAHPSYVARDGVVNGASPTIRVTAPTPASTVQRLPLAASVKSAGALRDPAVDDFRKGFATLEKVVEPDLVACPDSLAFSEDDLLRGAVVGSMVTHCEEFKRFAIVDSPNLPDDQELLDWRMATLTSDQSAAYAPHLRMVNLDPRGTERFVLVPPSGFVAGVFSRTDTDRGVFKAPANERVRGVVGLAKEYTQRQQDLLNPGSVNLIRPFRGRGIRVWGARTATDDTSWRYVPVRRLFNFLENSTRLGTQWVVFEPNDQRTWLRVRVSIENFLNQVWRAGGLFGITPDQAYQVRVGLGQTMTQTDIDLGLLVVEVAVAPVKPAEFVVFRFSHKVETESQ